MDAINRHLANGTLPDYQSDRAEAAERSLCNNLIASSLRKIAVGNDRNLLLDLSLKHEPLSLAHALILASVLPLQRNDA